MRGIVFAAALAASPAFAMECDTEGALAAVHLEIEGVLISPSSAQHQSLEEVQVDMADGRCFWRFETYVDAQNGFGAMVRATYTASVSQGDDGFTVLISGFQQRG